MKPTDKWETSVPHFTVLSVYLGNRPIGFFQNKPFRQDVSTSSLSGEGDTWSINLHLHTPFAEDGPRSPWPVCVDQAKKKPTGGVVDVHNRTGCWQILRVLKSEGTALAKAASVGSQAAMHD